MAHQVDALVVDVEFLAYHASTFITVSRSRTLRVSDGPHHRLGAGVVANDETGAVRPHVAQSQGQGSSSLERKLHQARRLRPEERCEAHVRRRAHADDLPARIDVVRHTVVTTQRVELEEAAE